MSTRCDIYKLDKKADKPILMCVYCHHDGYPSWVGKTLTQHYTEESKINQLFEGGDMSSLEEKVEECDFYEDWKDDGEPQGYDILPLDTNATGKELFEFAKKFILNREAGSDREYYYLWDGEKWHGWDWDGRDVAKEIKESLT